MFVVLSKVSSSKTNSNAVNGYVVNGECQSDFGQKNVFLTFSFDRIFFVTVIRVFSLCSAFNVVDLKELFSFRLKTNEAQH